MSRFLNADSYIQTGQGVLDKNMFAYCGNSPSNRMDPTGTFWIEVKEFISTAISEIAKAMQTMAPAYAGCGGAVAVDGPLPVGDVVALAVALCLTAGAIGYGVYQATKTAPSISIPKTKEKVKGKSGSKVKPPTIIYRYGGTNPGNLTPRKKDLFSGLSFSTVPAPGAAMTTIEALNATGLVYAVQNGPTHVSVYPKGGSMEDWINEGSSSVWTQAVKSTVIKWDGMN